MNYDLAIFDMDGTILNTIEDLSDTLNFALKKSGYPERTLEEARQFVGNGIHRLVERGVPAGTASTEIEQVFQDFITHYKDHCADKTRPYDGILTTILKLREAGCKTAVVSNKADGAVHQLCKRYFDGLFDTAVGEKSGVLKKPAPDSVNAVLEELHITRDRAVYIGDSEVDILTSVNAKMDHIIVEWGFREPAFLKESGANRMVTSPSEILSIILGNNK
ncbi:phosphoglycolate phosphatase [Lachnospiraceae bacterium KM106-2]|nr:phosphoglycolate phosphatase [Lachnospiraceae bacterium KM106-2]